MMRARYILPVFVLALFFGASVSAPNVQAAGVVQQGGICTNDNDCAGNLACLPSGSVKVCSVDSSLESSGYGKGDGSVAPGGACSTQNDCSGNYACINAVCAADNGLAAQGEACTSDNDCGGELACISGKCSVDPSLDPAAANTAAQKTPASLQGNQITETGDTIDYVMTVIMSAFAWLLGIAAITLDNAMYYTVVHMGSYINGLSAVGVAWRILRDIGNIILLFGFIALGITVILDVDWYGGTKMLPKLIISALFLNFSLFAAEAVIDVGNLFATEFYTQINNGSAAAPSSYSGTDIENNGISNAVMNQLGLQTIYNSAVNNTVSSNGQTNNLGIFKQGNPFIVGFMAIILFLIAAFVFFSLAFILIARFVVLILLIIIAPIGFAGLAVPKLDKTASLWWSTLFEQTITAPVMLLMLYVALAVITDSQFLTGFSTSGATNSAASTAAQDSWTLWLTTGNAGLGGLASIILSFLVAMGLLLMVTFLSKKLGAIGGEWITKTTSGVMTYPFRAGAKWGVGITGSGLENFRKTRVGRVAAGALKVGTLGLVGDYELKGLTDKMQKAKFGTDGSVQERREFAKKDKVEVDSAMRKRKVTSAIQQAQDDLKAGRITQDQADQIISKSYAALNDKEIAELDGIKKGVELLARNLSPQQFKSMMENKEISEEQKNKVREARFKKTTTDLDTQFKVMDSATASADEKEQARRQVQTIVRALPNSDLENGPPELLDNDRVLDALSESTRTDLIKSGRVGPAVTRRLKSRDGGEKVKKAFADAGGASAATTGAGAAAATAIAAAKMKPAKVAELPPEILKTEEVMDSFTPAVMAELAKELNSKDREDIADYFRSSLTTRTGTAAEAMKRYFKGPAGDLWGVTLP